MFDQTPFPLAYLTKPNPFLDMGLTIGKVDPAEQVQPGDKLFVIAYPHFNPQGSAHRGSNAGWLACAALWPRVCAHARAVRTPHPPACVRTPHHLSPHAAPSACRQR